MFDIVNLIKNDTKRMRMLSIVHALDLPDCYVAAGFLRNLVWDAMHSTTTRLNDIDVVFYDPTDIKNTMALQVTEQLNHEHSEIKWEAKNQAFMHIRNGDAPYNSTLDAMSFWPEKETAIGATLNDNGAINVVSAFGLESLFLGKISHNPKRSKEIFLDRVHSKKWLETWPQLEIN